MLIQPTPDPAARRRYSAQVQAALDLAPAIPPGVACALVTARAADKPWAFAGLDALARRIHRDRKGDPLQLTPVRIRCADGPRPAVKILAHHPSSDRKRLIGYAWIAGRPWEALSAALDRAEPAAGAWEPV